MSKSKGGISKGIDVMMIWLYILLVLIGITAIFAVTYREGDPVISTFFSFKTDYSKQFYFFIASVIIGILILLTDSKFFTATANLWYAFGIFLLILVFPFGADVKGTASIIRMGPVQFQPAEFCKVSVCLALAKYISLPDMDFTRTRSQLIAAAIALAPAIITIFQKETGLALVYLSFFIVMYREGLPPTVLIIGFSLVALVIAAIIVEPKVLAIILSVIAFALIFISRRQSRRHRTPVAAIILVWAIAVGIQLFAVPFIFEKVLQPHQVERIYSLFGKDDPNTISSDEIANANKQKTSDYNVRQSKIAIGSGGFIGKGLLRGTQTRYDFVPEQRTDFIFCTIGEGFGFVGTTVLLAIYLVLLFRIITIAERQRSVFSRCYAYGVAAVFFFHIAINVGMTVGLAPVIGIPLPLVSYGGTALLTFSILLFILIRLDADRQMVLR